MPFPFYRRLSRANKAVYRKSDALSPVVLSDAEALQPLAAAIERELAEGEPDHVAAACEDLALEICEQVGAGLVTVVVQEVRPSDATGELHGLYELTAGALPRITLWMRTAARGKVVAFRTFLRTFLHEVGHHLDFVHFRLEESFHTEGFFRRESSLFRQLVPGPEEPARPRRRAPARRGTESKATPAPPPRQARSVARPAAAEPAGDSAGESAGESAAGPAAAPPASAVATPKARPGRKRSAARSTPSAQLELPW